MVDFRKAAESHEKAEKQRGIADWACRESRPFDGKSEYAELTKVVSDFLRRSRIWSGILPDH